MPEPLALLLTFPPLQSFFKCSGILEIFPRRREFINDTRDLNSPIRVVGKIDCNRLNTGSITVKSGSNIEYDIWAIEMEHYLEYIDNEVWKVIQNGNSKKRISIGKDGVVRISWMDDENKKSGGSHRIVLAILSTSQPIFLKKNFLAGFANECFYSLFAQNITEDLILLLEDLDQIDDVDIEEMYINWQIAMNAIRMRKFYRRPEGVEFAIAMEITCFRL
ncbi:hypothetical protein Tco_1337349 [Tanacetum coccineum]